MKSEMINQMMNECCREDGKLDFEKMKGFMQLCGKPELGHDELEMMRQFCSQSGRPDVEMVKRLMEKCGC